MSDFKVIETQEQFDQMVADRINRAKDSVRKEYADYETLKEQVTKSSAENETLRNSLTELNERISKHDAEILERDNKIRAYEIGSVKTKIANELGLSFDAVSFLQGDDEESIRTSAEALKKLTGTYTTPLANRDPSVGDETKRAQGYKSLVETFKK